MKDVKVIYPNDSQRDYHPQVKDRAIWPDPSGYPWKDNGMYLWTREGLLRRTSGQGLIGTWTTGGFSEPWSGNYAVIRTSADNGATWQDAGTFTHPQRGLFVTEIFSPRENELHAFLNTYDIGVWMTQLLSYRAISRDGGKTWTGPHSIPGGIQGVWPNRGIQHSTGRWIIPVSWAELTGPEWAEPSVGRAPMQGFVGNRPLQQQELQRGIDSENHYMAGVNWADRNHRYVCGVMLSDDGGETFRLRGYLRGGTHGLLLEPRVVELSNGKVIMLIRSQRDGFLWRSESSDGGETWTPAVRSDIPNPAAKVNILRHSDGRIFLIHNPTTHEGAIMGGRNPLSLWVSEDDMKTWSIKLDLVKDHMTGVSLNYPDGFIDEAAGCIRMFWEDTYSVHLMEIPLSIR